MLNLEECFEKFNDDYLKFERVENKLNERPDLCAFILLSQILPGSRDIVAAAEHDEIFLDTDCDRFAEVATEDDILTLVRCGIRYDEETNSLCSYV